MLHSHVASSENLEGRVIRGAKNLGGYLQLLLVYDALKLSTVCVVK